MSTDRSAAPVGGTAPRVPLLDVLRGTAILCMLIAHGLPFLVTVPLSDSVLLLTSSVNRVASPLFGFAMGAAAALVWARAEIAREPVPRVLVDVGRGVVVYAIGVLVVELNTWVAVVLHVLGVLMIVGIPVAALAGAGLRRSERGDRTLVWILLCVTLVLFVAAPWLTGALAPDRLPNGTTGGLEELWAAFMAGSSYRAVSLLPFFALGALVAVSGLLARPRALALLAAPFAGALLLIVAATGALGGTAISGDPSDQLSDLTLVALAVAGVAGVVGLGGRVAVPVWSAVADLGAIALSVYVLQLIVLRPLMDWQGWLTSGLLALLSLTALVVVPSAVMIAWRRTLGPGPAERLVALVTGGRRAS
ncbi:MAG: heparan-alpha-glucosaminide N-acetyltransferase domain-containing protein [Dermatophilaceae bacterium]